MPRKKVGMKEGLHMVREIDYSSLLRGGLKMTLDFMPEIEQRLKARYSEALTAIIGKVNPDNMSKDFRKHVFDFFDGLRIVISRESTGLHNMLYYVASMHRPMDFDDSIEFTAFVLEHINTLKDEPITGMVYITYEKGILYISVPERPINPRLN